MINVRINAWFLNQIHPCRAWPLRDICIRLICKLESLLDRLTTPKFSLLLMKQLYWCTINFILIFLKTFFDPLFLPKFHENNHFLNCIIFYKLVSAVKHLVCLFYLVFIKFKKCFTIVTLSSDVSLTSVNKGNRKIIKVHVCRI